MLVVEGEHEPQFIAAEKVEAVDTTGAGDAFVGSFAYLLAAGRSVVDAARARIGDCDALGAQAGHADRRFPARNEVARHC